MDWLAGSRQHILELIITRTLVLAPIYVLGFSKEVIDAYIVIVGFQAVFNHANVSVPARAAALRDRHAELPPLAPLAGRRGDRPQLRGALRLHRLPVRHRRQGRPRLAGRATAWSATTCRTASSSSSRFRSSGRAEARRRALRATSTSPIVGAGAAGLHCAAIAGQLGCSVVLLDHAEKVAEKIRISGGGRCNFTNLDVGAEQLRLGESATSAARRWPATRRATSSTLVERHGIAWHEKHKGQLFCDGSSARDHRHAARRMRRRRRAALAAVPGRGGPRRRGGRSSSTRRAGRSQRRGSSSPPAASRSRRSAPATGATSWRAGSATGSSSRGRRWSRSTAPARPGSRSPRSPASRCRSRRRRQRARAGPSSSTTCCSPTAA